MEPIPEFDEHLGLGNYIPHSYKLKNSKDDTKFFINSTLNCLTNIKSFLEYLFYFNEFNASEYYLILRDAIKEINNNIEIIEKKNKNENIKEEKIESFNHLILNEIKLFKNKSNHDPRLLIDFIFNAFLNVSNKDEQESILNILSYDSLNKSNSIDHLIKNSYNELLNHSTLFRNNINKNENFEKKNLLNKTTIERSENLEKTDLLDDATIIGNNREKKENFEKMNFVITKEITCPDLNCSFITKFNRSFPTLHLYLSDNSEKEYTINECINNYFEKENEESEYMCSKCSKIRKNKSKSLFYKLPETLFIFIYYVNDFKNKKYYYKFEEILDLTNNTYVDKKVQYKKYFISSIITCKFPKTEKEFFYTYCRKDNNTDFLIYNSEEKKVRHFGNNIERQIHRLKDKDYDEKQSFPYVLIYSLIK